MASWSDHATNLAKWAALAATAPMRLRSYYTIPQSPDYAAQMNSTVPDDAYDRMLYAGDIVSPKDSATGDAADPETGVYSPSFPQRGQPAAPVYSSSFPQRGQPAAPVYSPSFSQGGGQSAAPVSSASSLTPQQIMGAFQQWQGGGR